MTHLFPERSFLLDIQSDHLALVTEFSSPWLPSIRPSPTHSTKGPSTPCCYNSTSGTGRKKMKDVEPPCDIASFNLLSAERQEAIHRCTVASIAYWIIPQRRPRKMTPNHSGWQKALQTIQSKCFSGRLPTLLQKFLRAHTEIDTFLEENSTNKFLTGIALKRFVNTALYNFGHQTPAPDLSTTEANWPIPKTQRSSTTQEIETPTMSFEAFLDIVRKSGKDKVCGPLQLPVPAILDCNIGMQRFLHNIIIQFSTKPSPLLMQTEIILLHKKGNPYSVKNYRPISLTTALYRIHTTWIQSHLLTALDGKLHTTQFGFLPFRQIHMQILRLLNAAACLDKAFVVLFDIEKAFDSVDLNLLFELLERYQLPPWLIREIKLLYSPSYFSVRLADGLTHPTLQNALKGLRQGCPLSALLFLIYIDPLLRKLGEHTLDFNFRTDNTTDPTAPTVDPSLPTHGGFADDVGLVTDDNHITQALQTFCNYCHDFGVKFHPDKVQIYALTPPKRHGALSPLKSWTVTTADGISHTFTQLPHSTAPLRYLGAFIHSSGAAIKDTICHDLNTNLERYKSMELGPAQRLIIVNQVLIPQLVYRLIPYPLLVDVKDLEDRLLLFLQKGGPRPLSSLSPGLTFPCKSLLALGVPCLHALTQSRFLCLIQSIVRNDPHTPPDLHTALSKRFNLTCAHLSLLPHLDPIVNTRSLQTTIGISSPLNPQTFITQYFSSTIPAGVTKSQTNPNTFTTITNLTNCAMTTASVQTLSDLGCTEAAELAPLWQQPGVHCYACCGEVRRPPAKPPPRIKPRLRNIAGQKTVLGHPPRRTARKPHRPPARPGILPTSPIAGCATVNCVTGEVHMCRTTGHMSTTRGAWLSIIMVLTSTPTDSHLLIISNCFQTSLLHSYLTHPNQYAKSLHRDLIHIATNLLRARTGQTRIAWVQSRAGITPQLTASKYAHMACSLPYSPPKPQMNKPALWILRGMTISLPASAPLLGISRFYHPGPLTGIASAHSINFRLSSLPLMYHTDPRMVTYMHGRESWAGFAFWQDYSTPQHCNLCHTTTHPTDIFTSMSQCPAFKVTSIQALCDGYKILSPHISQWFDLASSRDQRMLTRHLVPHTLVTHLNKLKLTSTFTKLHKTHPYLKILGTIRSTAQTLLTNNPTQNLVTQP